MQRVFLGIILFHAAALITPAEAQIQFPDLSYGGTIHQKVGFTNFTVAYERPMQRGRVIFGGLVPFGKPWKTGAGFANTISFDRDVFVQGKRIEKGSYLLITIPDPKVWKIMLSTDTIAFSKNKPYEPQKEVMRIDAVPEISKRHYEALTIDIDIVNNDALFTISWDHTSVSFTIQTGTTQQVMEQIRTMMQRWNGTPEQYSDAARFIAFNPGGMKSNARDTALILVNKALELDPKSWMYHTKRAIYFFSNDIKGYDAVTREWIDFLKKHPSGNDPNEIAVRERELASKRKSL
jgi:hypothetical protein